MDSTVRSTLVPYHCQRPTYSLSMIGVIAIPTPYTQYTISSPPNGNCQFTGQVSPAPTRCCICEYDPLRGGCCRRERRRIRFLFHRTFNPDAVVACIRCGRSYRGAKSQNGSEQQFSWRPTQQNPSDRLRF